MTGEQGAVRLATGEEIINTALCCAEGEAAIEEYEERTARAWLAKLMTEHDAALRLAEERAEMIATLTALLREARGYLPECIGLSEEIDALAADSAPDEGGA